MKNDAERFLSKNDKIMAQLIKQYGPCSLTAHTKYFDSLCSAIISQQLSVKVAATIEKRFRMLFTKSSPTPHELLSLSIAELRTVGLSAQKATYMHSLAQHFDDGHINTRLLKKMSDEDIITALTHIHGIGKWTAEMFLIFTMGRPDVFSVGDYGLRTAVSRLYGQNTPKEINSFAERWSPFRSTASWYLWRSLDNKQ